MSVQRIIGPVKTTKKKQHLMMLKRKNARQK